MCEWITLFDPIEHPTLSLADREKLLLSQAKSVAEKHESPYSASTLRSVLKDDPLSGVFDPEDDGYEVQFICKVFFFQELGKRQYFYCVEYDSSLVFWEEYEEETFAKMKAQKEDAAKKTWTQRAQQLPRELATASKSQKKFCRYLSQCMGSYHTNHAQFTRYSNGLCYDEVSSGSMMGSDVSHNTSVEKFKHCYIRGTNDRSRHGHDLWHLYGRHCFTSVDRRTKDAKEPKLFESNPIVKHGIETYDG